MEFVCHSSLSNPEPGDVGHLLGQHFLDGKVHLWHIDLLTANKKLHPVVLNEQCDVLPVSGGQICLLDAHDMLLVHGGVDHIQSVCLPVGDDLENGSRSVGLLDGQKAAPGFPELLQVDEEEEAPLCLDGVEEVPEGAVGDRGDQVCVQDLVRRAVGICTSDQTHSVVSLAHPGEVKQVIHTVIIPTLCGQRKEEHCSVFVSHNDSVHEKNKDSPN